VEHRRRLLDALDPEQLRVGFVAGRLGVVVVVCDDGARVGRDLELLGKADAALEVKVAQRAAEFAKRSVRRAGAAVHGNRVDVHVQVERRLEFVLARLNVQRTDRVLLRAVVL